MNNDRQNAVLFINVDKNIKYGFVSLEIDNLYFVFLSDSERFEMWL